MNCFEIKETGNTPHILFDPEKNIFILEGKSFPEDTKEFYTPVMDWLDKYRISNPKNLTVTFNIYYLSSSSIISVKQLLQKLVDFKSLGTDVKVIWKYDDDDDDIRKTGEDYLRITKLNFEFKVNS